MRKKIFTVLVVLIVTVVAIAANLYFSQSETTTKVAMSDALAENVDAIAHINPECPDGCVEGETTCYCNGRHEKSKAGLPPY